MPLSQTSDLSEEVSSGCDRRTESCEMSELLDMLTRPWMLHIIWVLTTQGPRRFGALRRAVPGISARILTVRVRMLEEHGFVTRSVVNSNPPEVTYSATERMQEMKAFMHQLHDLAKKWHEEDKTLGSQKHDE